MARRKIMEQIVLKFTVDTGGANQKIDQFNSQLERSSRSASRAKAGLDRFNQSSGRIPVTMMRGKKGIDNLRASIKQMDREQRMAAKSASLLSGSLKAIVAYKAIQFLQDSVTAANDVSLSFEKMNAVAYTAFGPSFQQNLDYASQLANKLGLDAVTAGTQFSKFAASTMGAGMSLEEVQGIFEGASMASSALKLSVDEQNGIFKAFSQIASKGTVQAEELRGQIGDRLPQAFTLAAKSMNVSEQELAKMMKRGEVMSKDFLPRFAQELKNTFQSGALKAANDTIARSNRETNRLKEQLKPLGDAFREVGVDIKAGAATSMEWLNGVFKMAHWTIKEMNGTLDDHLAKMDEADSKNKKVANSQEDLNKKLEETKERYSDIAKAFDKLSIDKANAGTIDDIRIKLGLTEEGFDRTGIRDVVEEQIKAGHKIEDILKHAAEHLSNITDKLRDIDTIEGKSFKEAEKEIADRKFQRHKDIQAALKLGMKMFDPNTFAPKWMEDTSGGQGRTITEALENGTAEAMKFLIRPDSEDIQNKQLSALDQIVENTKNPFPTTNVVGASY